MPQGLPKRIRFAFVTQALLASVAMVVGIVVVGAYVRDTLLDRWLDTEAAAFWANGGNAAELPRSALLQAWFVTPGDDPAAVPPRIRELAPGKHVALGDGEPRHVLLDRRAEGDLYLAISTHMVNRMAWLTALLLGGLGLLGIAVISWLTYRRSRLMVLPVNRLSDVVAQWNPNDWDAAMPVVLPYPLAADTSKEMRALSSALGGLATRMAEFVQRERDFTRDASHELRTPLTVVRVATDMMLGDPAVPAHMQRSLLRIQRAVQDMETLVDAFLILARERHVAPQTEEFALRDLVEEEVDKARALLQDKPVELHLVEHASPRLLAPPRVLSVMLGHLLSNACTFTEQGRIDVEIDTDEVRIRDTGIGMSEDTLRQAYDPFFRADQFNPIGKGIGLTIVRRLGDRFGWPVTLESEPSRGTLATIRFGNASVA
ncbi:HAMP domain-containing histidine kinase [Luteimonas aestuarii]|uniref:histidine kinase n=1 Tax=Luteimonas aestuarii TaxID=453837 RepID=A0A4R5TNM8_9GAMM|nr:HAMP domain-containing sensor histidine kinase [Luteimonas aestuarii]TDK21703.1 HAMP domain-containing histidine kinase [Luteimonas aestuarii]